MTRGCSKMMKHSVSCSHVNETCSACVYLIKMQPSWFDNSNNPYWKYQFHFDILFIPTEDSPGGPCRSDPGRVCEGTWPPLLLRRWRTRLGRSRPSPARPCPGRTTADRTGGPGPGHLWVSWSFWSAPWTADQETILRNSRNSSRFHVPRKSTGWVPSLRKARPYNMSCDPGITRDTLSAWDSHRLGTQKCGRWCQCKSWSDEVRWFTHPKHFNNTCDNPAA